jgi:hypothetical protein
VRRLSELNVDRALDPCEPLGTTIEDDPGAPAAFETAGHVGELRGAVIEIGAISEALFAIRLAIHTAGGAVCAGKLTGGSASEALHLLPDPLQ